MHVKKALDVDLEYFRSFGVFVDPVIRYIQQQDTFYECYIIVLSLCPEAWQELFNLMISNPALLGMKASQMVGINNHECTYVVKLYSGKNENI